MANSVTPQPRRLVGIRLSLLLGAGTTARVGELGFNKEERRVGGSSRRLRVKKLEDIEDLEIRVKRNESTIRCDDQCYDMGIR